MITLKTIETQQKGMFLSDTGEVPRSVEIKGLSIDSRTLEPGMLFVAIRGPRFDGHTFLKDVVKKDAIAAIIHQDCVSVPAGLPVMRVPDTCHALGTVGRVYRDSLSIPVIGLTGSCGKTTTKSLLASILSQSGQVVATQGNLNNYYGVPLTLARLQKDTDVAVIELGTNAPGEIAYLTRLVQPTIAIVTNAGPVHLEKLVDVSGVAKEKGALFEGLDSSGVAIINADDPQSSRWHTQASHCRILTFSQSEQANAAVTASQIHQQPNKSVTVFRLNIEAQSVLVELALMGNHHISNALAAAAAAHAAGVSIDKIQQGLMQCQPVNQRLVKYRGYADAVIIDDTYNANPLSTRAALAVLAECQGRKIFVMGEMGELGDRASDYHAEIGGMAKQMGIDCLLTCGGEFSKCAAKAFGGNAQHFKAQSDLIDELRGRLDSDTTVLIKGSRSARMENIVQALVNAVNVL